jgi:hypothetical protein
MTGLPRYSLCRQPLFVSLVVVNFTCIALIGVRPVLAIARVGSVLCMTDVIDGLWSVVGGCGKGFFIIHASNVSGDAAPVAFWFG